MGNYNGYNGYNGGKHWSEIKREQEQERTGNYSNHRESCIHEWVFIDSKLSRCMKCRAENNTKAKNKTTVNGYN